MKVNYQDLIRYGVEIYTKAGVPEADARDLVEELVGSNLAGVDSHGVLRIQQYLDEMKAGSIVAGAPITVVKETPSIAIVDCNHNFGHVVARRMVDIVAEKAKKVGIACAVSVHANHVGRLGSYTEKLADQGLLGYGTVGVYTIGPMAPWGAKEPKLGTNPISMAVPRAEGKPSVFVDCATTVIAEGKLRTYIQQGKQVPVGWIKDNHGKDTTNPLDFYQTPRGSIMPMGGSVCGAKGSGLALMANMFGVALGNDTTFGWSLENKVAEAQNGLFLMAVDPEAFFGEAAYREQSEKQCEYIKNSTPAEGFSEVLLPGEFEQRNTAKNKAEGINLPETTWNGIVKLGKEYGCEWAKDFELVEVDDSLVKF